MPRIPDNLQSPKCGHALHGGWPSVCLHELRPMSHADGSADGRPRDRTSAVSEARVSRVGLFASPPSTPKLRETIFVHYTQILRRRHTRPQEPYFLESQHQSPES